MELDERKKQILGAIIESYIETAEPVGSRTIAKNSHLNVSPATIRNEMADLEEMGLLEQPHTSAGRIPSEKGYRMYVDRLMKKYQLTRDEINRMRYLMKLKIAELDTLIKEITEIYSKITKYTLIGTMPESSRASIRHFQIIPIGDGELLLIIVTNNNIVKDTKLYVDAPVSMQECTRISNILNEHLTDIPCNDIDIEKIMLIQRELRENHEIVRPILQFIYECVEANDNASVFHRGITNLLNFPEYRDISKARRILDFLDDKSSLQKAFVYRECENVTILIGSENRALELKDCSVILSPYHIDGKIVGTIGFIGPTRMNYAKAVSNIEFLAGQLNKLSDKFTNENDF